MKKLLGAALVCMSMFFAASAFAADNDELMDGAYDAGHQAASDFCDGIKGKHGGHVSLTAQLRRACREGFRDEIDGNKTCQKRLENMGLDGYPAMRDAMLDACP